MFGKSKKTVESAITEIDTKVNNVKSIVGTTYTYQVGTSMTDVPTGEWLTSMPNVPQGQYLWTKETTLYSDATTSVGYIATRMGVDGAGGATGPAGPQGPQGEKERKVILESKDPRVIPAQLELRARRAIQERKDHRVIRAYKGKLAQKEIPERQVLKDHKATKVFLVKMRIMLRLSEVITITHKLEKTRGCG